MTKPIMCVLITLLVLFGCTDNPTGPASGIQVTVPEKNEVWKSWLDSFLVEWVPTESDSVLIQLYNGTELLGSISGWTENDGSYIRTEHLMCCEESGAEYRIKITDNLGNTGLSETFIIDNELDVFLPSEGHVWYRCGGQYIIEWTPSCAEFVWINLLRNGVVVANLDFIHQYIGYYVIEDSLADSLGTGSDYTIQIVDFNGFEGYSGLFSIEDSSPGPIGMQFAVIPPGTFLMGAPYSEQGSTLHERPVHAVSLDYSFQISTTEITQDQWMAVMPDNPSHFQGGERPVDNVSWLDCHAFLDSLNMLDQTWTYRLPSEAEWEYSCRSGSTISFYWGIDMNGDYCWYYTNSQGESHPVGQKLPNLWGLLDMSGNLLEWCEDSWHDTYDGAPSDGSPWLNGSSPHRVIRGGCWNFAPDFCRSAFRFRYDKWFKSDYLGFRVVRS